MNGDPLFLTKIIGAVLTAGLVAMVSGFVAHQVYVPVALAAPAYAIGGSAPAAAKPVAAAPAGPAPIAAMLASADAALGEKLSKKCKACHTFNKGGAKKVGPNLWNVVGGARAAAAGFKYSGVLKAMGGTWTIADLNAFLLKPKAFAKGTKMGFAGLKKTQDRANIVRFMVGMADSPIPLPK
ncbi:c-type cytochrome [bacterium AH-315-B06]|nr:c-type cytochrome [bacterium AH-315-B06]